MISFVKILSGFYTHDSDISINDAALIYQYTLQTSFHRYYSGNNKQNKSAESHVSFSWWCNKLFHISCSHAKSGVKWARFKIYTRKSRESTDNNCK